MGQPTGSAPAEPVIDLGELTGEVPSDADEGPVRPPRRLTLAVVAVLIVVGLAGDPAPPSLRTVLTTTFAPIGFDTSGDLLYAVDGAYVPNRILAYRLRDGRRLWEVRSPTNATYEGVWPVGERTLLVPDACTAAGSVSTVAVDNASGHEVWRRPGVAETRISGSGLVLMARPHPTTRCKGYGSVDASPEYWDAVDAVTGAVRWSTEVPEFDRITFDSDDDRGARRVVLVGRDGTVTIRDLTTGAITGRVMLSELAKAGDESDPRTVPDLTVPDLTVPDLTAPDVTVAGGHVLVVRRQVGWRRTDPVVLDVTAYDVVTLARRWRVRVEAGASDQRSYNLTTCGSMLCLHGGESTVVLDPRDGAERWRAPLVLLSVTGRWALLADRRANDQPPSGALMVRELRTGKLRAAIPGWRVLSVDGLATGPPVLGITVRDRTWLAELDPARVRVLSRGSVPGWYGSCSAEAGYIACRRLDGTVRIWRAIGT